MQSQRISTGRTAWLTAVGLLLTGAGSGLTAAIGIATPDVAGTLGVATAAAWVALLPGILALIVTAIGPIAGLAVVAGAGIAGAARLIADVFVAVQPESVARPELLYPLSGNAYPLTSSAGGWLLAVLDLLAVVIGVVAARSLARAVHEYAEAAPDPLTEDGSAAPAPRRSGADGTFGDASFGDASFGDASFGDASFGDTSFGETSFGDTSFGDTSFADTSFAHAGPAPAVRNMQVLAVGFIGIAVFGFSAIQSTYTGGYIEKMFYRPGSDAGTVIAPVLLAFVALAAVSVAGTLSRAVAVSLLGGVAVAAAVPALTALVAVSDGAPAQVSSSVIGALIGALILASAGLLTRTHWQSADPASAGPASTTPAPTDTDAAGADRPARSALLGRIAAGLGLLSGLLLLAASLVHLLIGTGPADSVAGQVGLADDQTQFTFLLAGIVLIVASVAACWGRSAIGRAGRSTLTVGWAAAICAIARPITVLSDYRAGTEQAQLAIATSLPSPDQQPGLDAIIAHWRIGPGLWLALVAAAAGIVAAVIAGFALARELDEDTTVRDDDAAERSGRLRRWLAAAVAVVAVVALALPLSSVVGVTTSALFSLGGAVSWAAWAVLAAVLIAVSLGAVTRQAEIVAGALPAAPAVVAVYLWSPPGLRALGGYRAEAGMYAGWALVALLLAGGTAMWWSVRHTAPAAPESQLIPAPAPARRKRSR